MKNKTKYCNHMPFFPTKEEWLESQYKAGLMIKKADLKDRGVYLGECRNANMAIWVKGTNKFVHQRTKFGSVFLEEIEHPEDDIGYDVFIPHLTLEEVENNPLGFAYYQYEKMQDFEKSWEKIKEINVKEKEYLAENIEQYIKSAMERKNA